MPPTTPAISIVTDTREDAEVPSSNTLPLVKHSHGPGKGNARALLTRRRAGRVAGTSGYHDPLFDRPDLVEDDYYRFRNHPSG